MVGGAYGQVGHRVRRRVVVVPEQGNALATILLPRGVEVIALVATLVNRHATLPAAQVRP